MTPLFGFTRLEGQLLFGVTGLVLFAIAMSFAVSLLRAKRRKGELDSQDRQLAWIMGGLFAVVLLIGAAYLALRSNFS